LHPLECHAKHGQPSPTAYLNQVPAIESLRMPASSFRNRNLQPEIMDSEGLDPAEHHRALVGIARVNRISASPRILWPSIRDLCLERQKASDARPVRILDIATGGGDVPVGLWRLGQRHGFAIEVAGCDFSDVAIEHARQTAARANADVSFFQLDLLNEAIPAGYDVITCSLFLHHLNEEQALAVLRKMRDSAGTLALVNDLARSRRGWWAAYFGSRILTRSHVVHVDALLSVEGAFTPAEALAAAHRAGWDGATVRRKFPFRFLLAWRRS
jgi:2-polyprenyl-3-methyl-5-hydroxy-6-metoxy-1,4-benzoquinol methylase